MQRNYNTTPNESAFRWHRSAGDSVGTKRGFRSEIISSSVNVSRQRTICKNIVVEVGHSSSGDSPLCVTEI